MNLTGSSTVQVPSIPPIPSTQCRYCFKQYSTEAKLQDHINLHCKARLFIMSGMNYNGTPNPDSVRFTETEKDNLIRRLLYNVANLERKFNKINVEFLKMKRKQTIQIVRILNTRMQHKSKYTVQQWLQTTPITVSHVSHVFQKNINEAIKQVFYDAFNISTNTQVQIPILGYFEKANKLYMYSQETNGPVKWVTCDHGLFRKMCTIIATRFIQIYVENEEYYLESHLEEETKQEQKMDNFNRIMDTSYKNSDFINDFMEKIYTKIKQKWPFDDLYEDGEDVPEE